MALGTLTSATGHFLLTFSESSPVCHLRFPENSQWKSLMCKVSLSHFLDENTEAQCMDWLKVTQLRNNSSDTESQLSRLHSQPLLAPRHHSCLGLGRHSGPCCHPLPSRRCWHWKLEGPPVCRDSSELSELQALSCQLPERTHVILMNNVQSH